MASTIARVSSFILFHTAIKFGLTVSQFFHTVYNTAHNATSAAITSQIGDNKTHNTTPIADSAAVSGHIMKPIATRAVVSHNIAVVTNIIFALSFGFSVIHSAMGVNTAVIPSVNFDIAGMRAVQIVCWSAKLAASCRATAPAYHSAYFVASQTWNFVSAMIH